MGMSDGARDPESGRFIPGNCANPAGRPRGSGGWGTRLRSAVRGEVDRERVLAVWKALEVAALGGDVAACRAYLNHAIGDRPLLADADDEALLDAEAIRSGEIGGAAAAVVAAFTEGKVSASELRTLIEAFARIAETVGFDERLKALETGRADPEVAAKAERLRTEIIEQRDCDTC